MDGTALVVPTRSLPRAKAGAITHDLSWFGQESRAWRASVHKDGWPPTTTVGVASATHSRVNVSGACYYGIFQGFLIRRLPSPADSGMARGESDCDVLRFGCQ